MSFEELADSENYSKYTFEKDNVYIVTSRIDDTCLCVNAKPEYKEKITELLKKLNY